MLTTFFFFDKRMLTTYTVVCWELLSQYKINEVLRDIISCRHNEDVSDIV